MFASVIPEFLEFVLSSWECVVGRSVLQPWRCSPDPLQQLNEKLTTMKYRKRFQSEQLKVLFLSFVW